MLNEHYENEAEKLLDSQGEAMQEPAEAVAEGEETLCQNDGCDQVEMPNEGKKAEKESADTLDSEPTEETAPGGKRKKKPYHERYYLRYGDVPGLESLDLGGTREFLVRMGFDGGELRQARKGKDYAVALQQTVNSSGPKNYCSYCGCEIAGVDYYRVPDGRLRCTTCSATIVKTTEEIRKILHRVLDNLENFFGASIKVPIDIQLLEHRKLKKKIRCSISEVDNKSVLILGVAINKNKKYSVLLENGAPRISMIATFAHELTHIWQYTHWDNVKGFPKCAPAKRLLVYEGMAKWAEIQYLYLIGETAVAQREELYTRNRQDEYGVGFRIYEDAYPLTREAMTCMASPFTPGRYPFD